MAQEYTVNITEKTSAGIVTNSFEGNYTSNNSTSNPLYVTSNNTNPVNVAVVDNTVTKPLYVTASSVTTLNTLGNNILHSTVESPKNTMFGEKGNLDGKVFAYTWTQGIDSIERIDRANIASPRNTSFSNNNSSDKLYTYTWTQGIDIAHIVSPANTSFSSSNKSDKLYTYAWTQGIDNITKIGELTEVGKLPDINSYIWYKPEHIEAQFKRDVVKSLYSNSAFLSPHSGTLLDAQSVAREAIHRANVLWEMMPSSWKKD